MGAGVQSGHQLPAAPTWLGAPEKGQGVMLYYITRVTVVPKALTKGRQGLRPFWSSRTIALIDYDYLTDQQ